MPTPTQAQLNACLQTFGDWVCAQPDSPEIVAGQATYAKLSNWYSGIIRAPRVTEQTAETSQPKPKATTDTGRRRGRPAKTAAPTVTTINEPKTRRSRGRPGVQAAKSGINTDVLVAAALTNPGITVGELRKQFSTVEPNIMGRMLNQASKATKSREMPLIALTGPSKEATTQIYPAAGSSGLRMAG